MQPATAKGVSTRERILIGACEQLVKHGYEAFVLRDLAESLGMKLGNLQYYFKTRESLAFHVIEMEAAKDVEVIEGHLQAGASAMAALESVVRDLVTRWRGSTGGLFSTLALLAMHNAAFRELYTQIYSRFYAALKKLLHEVNPELSDEEITIRVRIITSLIDGSAMQIQVGDIERFLERIQQQALVIAITNPS